MGSSLRWGLIILSLIALPLRLDASPSGDLREAERAYERGDYRRVIQLISPLLYPKIQFSDSQRTIKAYTLLGISYVFEKNNTEAEIQFLAILSQRPGFRLDPLFYPEAAVELFEEVKRQNAEKIQNFLERERQEQEGQRQADLLRQKEQRRPIRPMKKNDDEVIVRTIINRPYWLNFMPLGVGQFQNGHRKKAYILMSTQLSLMAISAGTAIGVRTAYSGHPLGTEQYNTAQALNTVQLVSASLCVASIVYGVIDALVYYQPQSITVNRYKKSPLITLRPPSPSEIGGLGLNLRF
jgi:hypothetical protein